jgi:hypothetical protein
VHHAEVLNVAAVTDSDKMDITADHTSKPDTYVFTHRNPTDNIGRIGDPYTLFHVRGVA